MMLRMSRSDYRRLMGAKRPGKSTARQPDPVRYAEWLREMRAGAGVFVAIRTQTPGNSRRHWTLDAREAKQQRSIVTTALQSRRASLPTFPSKVIFTRYGPGRMDRHNLPGALKHIIDAVAKFYGVDDGDARWNFEFAGVVSRFHGVRIELLS